MAVSDYRLRRAMKDLDDQWIDPAEFLVWLHENRVDPEQIRRIRRTPKTNGWFKHATLVLAGILALVSFVVFMLAVVR